MVFKNALIQTYAIAASLMCLKIIGQAFVTVYYMITCKGGYLHPEDIKPTPLNPNPSPDQLKPYPQVERSRAMQRNDAETVPAFLIAGLLYILTDPPLLAAQVLLYGYVISRLLHAYALGTGKIHDLRATFWSIGVIITVIMSVLALSAALRA